MDDQVLETGAVASDLVDNGLPEFVAIFGRPWSGAQFRRAVLHEIRHPVLARWRHGRVPARGNGGFNERVIRPAFVLPAIVSPLHGLERSGEALQAPVNVTTVRNTREPRHAGQRDVYLAGRSSNLVVNGFLVDARGQVVLVHDASERPPRIEIRHDNPCPDLVTILEHDADRFAILDQHPLDPGILANLATVLLQGTGNGI